MNDMNDLRITLDNLDGTYGVDTVINHKLVVYCEGQTHDMAIKLAKQVRGYRKIPIYDVYGKIY